MNSAPLLQAAGQDHLELLTANDRAWLAEVFAEDTPDPGTITLSELKALSPRERERFRRRRTRFLRMMPLLETPVVTEVMRTLRLLATSSIRSNLHQQDIPILDGEPGVGKTHILQTHAGEEMWRLALHRSLDLED